MSDDKQNSLRAHRRQTRRMILLPFVGGLLLVIVLVIIAALAGRAPVSGIANTMLTLLVLCPAAICLLPIYLLLVMAVYGMTRAHDAIAKPLYRLEMLTATLRDRTYSVTDRAARASINLNARFAPLDKLIFSAFDRREDDHE